MISLSDLNEAVFAAQGNYIHAKHWPIYDRFIGWLYHFGLVQKHIGEHSQDSESYSQNKRWRGLWVDYELKDSWLERLNNIPCIEIVLTCAGHGPDKGRVRFIPFCDPRADRYAPVADKMALGREIQERFRGLADVGAGFGPDGSSEFGFGDLLMEFFTLNYLKPRNAMSKTELNNWWEAAISRLEEYANEEVQRWGGEAKGQVMPKDLQPPFFGHWLKLEPSGWRDDEGYVGPFSTVEEAYVAAEAAAREAGITRMTRSQQEHEASAIAARAGNTEDYIEGFIAVDDVHDRRYYGPLSF